MDKFLQKGAIRNLRELTKEQKKLLDIWFNKNKENIGISFDVQSNDNFSNELYEKLQKINDTEVLNVNINSYIVDKLMEIEN